VRAAQRIGLRHSHAQLKKAKHGAEGPKLNLLQLKGKEIKEITVPFKSS
jgi:hypothetical protein